MSKIGLIKQYEEMKATPEHSKYKNDGAFCEPVVMCDSCNKLIIVAELKKRGMCGNCGNTRVRNVRTMNEENMIQAVNWADQGLIDPDWLALFKAVP